MGIENPVHVSEQDGSPADEKAVGGWLDFELAVMNIIESADADW